jgi:hypothetical protein
VYLVLIETTKLLTLNVEAECELQFPNHFKGLNGDMIWKLLISVCGLKFMLEKITINK